MKTTCYRSGRGILEVLSQKFGCRYSGKQTQSLVRIAGVPVPIRTEYLPDKVRSVTVTQPVMYEGIYSVIHTQLKSTD